jgi:quercetin dioxygenase-like cupin family protein
MMAIAAASAADPTSREEAMAKTRRKAAAASARPLRAKARTAARRPGARAKPKATAKPKPKAKPKALGKARPGHRFTVSHHRDEDFRTDGLRAYAAYRNLGIDAATDGMVVAQVVRFVPPCRPEEVSKLHYHDVDFQMVYVLKGWMTSEFEGQGAITMRAGSCWIQPPRIKHKVVDYSDDCEVLEIVLPAEFETVTLEP